MQPTRILLTGGLDPYFIGLHTELKKLEGIEVIGAVPAASAPVQEVHRLHPQLVMVNLQVSCRKAPGLIHSLRRQFPHLEVIAVSLIESWEDIAVLLQAGARGCLHKNCSPAELQKAVHTVLKGRYYISYNCTLCLSQLKPAPTDPSLMTPRPPAIFTPREQAIIHHICEGHSNKQIAGLLQLSENMIERHRTTIRGKMGVKSVSGMVLYAVRNGLHGQRG